MNTPSIREVSIRPIPRDGLASAYTVLHELRETLGREAFLQALKIQEPVGYVLIGAYAPELVGVMGIRAVHTMARGWHLHVDDLVVTRQARKMGVGEKLLGFAHEEARRRAMKHVFLDAIESAVGFYERQGYAFHHARLMRKPME